eukprot:169346-Chlamydomonas_euryale.AAC.4
MRQTQPRKRSCCMLSFGFEFEGHAVDAVALVSGGWEALALENVAEVSATVGARNLHALHPVRDVLKPVHGAFQVVIERRPACVMATCGGHFTRGRGMRGWATAALFPNNCPPHDSCQDATAHTRGGRCMGTLARGPQVGCQHGRRV